eukprot:824538-Rhodomonas_salina.1
MIQDIVSLDGPIAIVLLIPATVVPSSALEIQDIAMLALAVGFGSQVEEGIKKFAMEHYPPLKTPIPGLHLVGVSVGDSEHRSKLDESACLQA